MAKPKPFVGMPMYEKKRQDISFQTKCGQQWKLTWEKNEYRAYVYMHGGWKEMKLGSIRAENLMQYIKETYESEVR